MPLSLLGAFLLLDLRGIPANLISMGAIDFGIIVDSAVVVMENLLRLLETRQSTLQEPAGRDRRGGAADGPAHPFFQGILLTAFIPLYTMQRVEGKIFRPMALTLTFALIVGTILALTVVPVLASFAVKHKIAEHESFLVRGCWTALSAALDWAIKARVSGARPSRWRAWSPWASCWHYIGSEFLPKLDEGALWVRGFHAGNDLAHARPRAWCAKARQILATFPEVDERRSASSAGPTTARTSTASTWWRCGVPLKPRDEWKTAHTREELCDAMKRSSPRDSRGEFQFSQVIEDNVNEAVSGIKSELSVKIFGEDPESCNRSPTRSSRCSKRARRRGCRHRRTARPAAGADHGRPRSHRPRRAVGLRCAG